jgi:biotin operon repressor
VTKRELARVNRYLRRECLGKDNAVSREDLAATVRLHDRKVRACIERLREIGRPIGVGKGGGYYYASNDDERREALAEYDKSLFRRLVVRNRMARYAPGASALQLVLVEDGGQGRLI